MNVTTTAVAAAPATLLVMGSVAGATAQITHADPTAVKKALFVTGGLLLASSLATGHPATILATTITLGGIAYITKEIWPWIQETES